MERREVVTASFSEKREEKERRGESREEMEREGRW